MKIDFQIVAVREGDGRVLTVGLVGDAGAARDEHGPLSHEAREQFDLACSMASEALRRPPLAAFRRHDVAGVPFRIALPPGERFEGPSVGLSFFLAFMALGLGCPLRRDRIFSAKLNRLSPVERDGQTLIELGDIGGGLSKVAAANRHALKRLWIATNENELLDAQERYLRGDPHQSLLPIRLDHTQPCPLAGLLLMGVDISELLKAPRGATAPGLLRFILGGADLSPGNPADLLPSGLHALIERLKSGSGATPLENNQVWRTYWCDVQETLFRAIEREPDHQRRIELFQMALSSWPDPRYPVDRATPVADNLKDLLSEWGRSPDVFILGRLLRVLQILRSIQDPDIPGPEEYAQELAIGFNRICSEFTLNLQSLDQDSIVRSFTFGKSVLIDGGVVSQISAIDAGALKAVRSAVFGFLRPMEELARSGKVSAQAAKELEELSASVRWQIKFYDLSDEEHCMRSDPKDALQLTFSGAESEARARVPLTVRTAEDSYRNGLMLDVEAPHGVRFRVRSPALLFEPYIPELYRSSFMRTNAVPADQILSRVDQDHSKIAGLMFGRGTHPNRIAYRFRDGREASVRWTGLGWPPAIDSILLAKAIEDDRIECCPERLIDVGSGTAFLALVAATKWPSVRHVDLIDLAIDAAISGQLNMVQAGWDGPGHRAAGTPEGRTVHTHHTDFAAWNRVPADILVANPPYLPDRPIPLAGIQLATNNTKLLTDVIRRAPDLTKHAYLVCSAIAWPELQLAIHRCRRGYTGASILSRTFVKFRIPWLEKTDRNPGEHRKIDEYFQSTLLPRGVLDLDDLNRPHSSTCHHIGGLCSQEIDLPVPISNDPAHLVELRNGVADQAELLRTASRGFRYWHEIRCVRLDVA